MVFNFFVHLYLAQLKLATSLFLGHFARTEALQLKIRELIFSPFHQIFIFSVLWITTAFSLPGRLFGVETRGCGYPCTDQFALISWIILVPSIPQHPLV